MLLEVSKVRANQVGGGGFPAFVLAQKVISAVQVFIQLCLPWKPGRIQIFLELCDCRFGSGLEYKGLLLCYGRKRDFYFHGVPAQVAAKK
jgi:hypothetical protein